MPDPILIGLMGRAGAGKDTAAEHLAQAHGFHRHAFAEPLRSMLDALLVECGLDYAYIHEPKLKEQPIPGLGHSYRQLAQTLGTEWARQYLGEDFWLRCADLCLGLQPGGSPVHDRIVLTDVRFPNEAAWVQARGGVLVRIERPDAPDVRAHISEYAVAHIEPWAVAWNTGGLSHLQLQLDDLVARLQLSAGPAKARCPQAEGCGIHNGPCAGCCA